MNSVHCFRKPLRGSFYCTEQLRLTALVPPLPAGYEEVSDELDALRSEDAFCDLYPVVEQLRVSDSEFAPHAAEPKIAGPVDQTFYTGMDQRACAHGTRFQSYV